MNTQIDKRTKPFDLNDIEKKIDFMSEADIMVNIQLIELAYQ